MDELRITVTLRRRPGHEHDHCELTLDSTPWTHLGSEPTQDLSFREALAEINNQIGDAVADHFTVGYSLSDNRSSSGITKEER